MVEKPLEPRTKSSEKRKLIDGLVADIINEREVALNIGQRDGVQLKMRFAILEESGYEIRDPKTKEILGTLPPREKIRVQIVELEERFSIARTYETRMVNVGGIGANLPTLGLGRLFEAPEYVEQPYTFRADDQDDTYFERISPEKSIVKIGDPVRQIIEEQ